MAGRTVTKHTRVYINGYDMSGYTRSIGPLLCQFDAPDLTTIGDAVRGALPSHVKLGIGTLNGVMDNTATSGLHVNFNAPGASRVVMIPIGMRAAPAAGDPVYNGRFYQDAYSEEDDGGAAVVSLPFGDWDVANLVNYSQPWGVLLHPLGAETAVNTAVGIDDRGAATALGGYMAYQVTAGNGTATVKVQDAATNVDGSFADLTGATTGVTDFSSPAAGIVAIGTTATVRRYLRWQIVLGTATTITFALSFVRI